MLILGSILHSEISVITEGTASGGISTTAEKVSSALIYSGLASGRATGQQNLLQILMVRQLPDDD